MGLILDSTVLIDAERASRTVPETLQRILAAQGDQEIGVSVITIAELEHGVWRANRRELQLRRQEFVEEVLVRIPVRLISVRVARLAGRIDAELRLKGKPVPLPDLLIGATALDLGFTLLTGNERHFRSVPGLRVRKCQ